ncbi:N,N-dimethylformamidase beta subunit family domain-containing protein [Chloroflexota bacterium]
MFESIRACYAGQWLLRHARLVLSVASTMLLLAVAFGPSASPLIVPPNHAPEATDCLACHGLPPDGNEEGALANVEGLYLADNQDSTRPLADGQGTIRGYASSSSVRQGATIQFHTSAKSGVQTYDLVVFRAGQEAPVPLLTVENLPAGEYECGPVGVEAGQEHLDLGCDWPVAYTLRVPHAWPSGIYAATMLNDNDCLRAGRWASYILFVVTEDQPGSASNVLFQCSTNTWQAYNRYGGWSLYSEPPARRVTFDRPYYDCSIGTNTWSSCKILWEIPLASWLESEGYAVEYTTNEEMHTDPDLLSHYDLLLSVGHDEYWSRENREQIDGFIDAGGNVAFFSGNTGYRQIRYQEDLRTLVCYKLLDVMLDPLYGVDNDRVATSFFRPPVNWPENTTTGVGFRNGGYVNFPDTGTVGRYTAYRTYHWVFDETGLREGDSFEYEPELAVEVDGALFEWENGLPIVTGEDESPLNYTILGLEPSTAGHATMGVYSRPSGGTVFNAATMGWGRGLWPENNPRDYETVRQITRNVLETLSGAAPGANRAPLVKAGPDRTATLGEPVHLDGSVSDDGRPVSPGQVTALWSLVSGPGTVAFDDDGAVDTIVRLDVAGVYVLRLTATDGELLVGDQMTVTVLEPLRIYLPAVVH